jgi:hypothetical protein
MNSINAKTQRYEGAKFLMKEFSLCLCTAIRQDHRVPRGFWTAVAERSGDTAFRLWTDLPKRRGASLPAAVQNK